MEEIKKGIIYMIKCNITGEVYYGSSLSSIEERMRKHRAPSNHCISKQIIERGDYTYNVVLECYVPNKIELLKIENMFIKNNLCINTKVAYQSEEDVKKYQNNYYTINIKIRKAYFKNYRKKSPTIQCPCGSKFKQYHKKRHERSKRHIRWLNEQEENNDDYDDFDEIEQ